MFNTREEARHNKEALENLLAQSELNSPDKQFLTRLAYKRSEPILEQLANVVKQKGITEFENFWAWLSSLQQAPDWFTDAMKAKEIELFKAGSTNFEDLQDHFEAYAKSVREGYNVILVSHSQGNFYANQAMRKLSEYTDGSLTGSISKKSGLNPLFPKFNDLFSNIQVATPVSATISNSPWTTFKDDLPIAAIRGTIGALPGNVQSSGVGLPPDGDFLGHSFIKAYLRVDESKQKVISDIKNAYSKIRYPIGYFQPAVVIEHEYAVNEIGAEHLDFSLWSPSGEEFGSFDEEWPTSDVQLQKNIGDCFKLHVGDSTITAETVVDHNKDYNFKYTAWPNGGVDRSKEKPVVVEFKAAHGIRRWDVGMIHVKKGDAKEPLEVN
ncbi:MAG: hypothetical protein WCF65_09660, partial [Parachlamydiaceae bacterium]